jgi:hypothetical protein
MLERQPIRPICQQCNKMPARSNGVSVKGFQLWHKLCGSCAKKKYTKPIEKDIKCGECGFVAKDPCQLDFIDGKTICANCHRLHIKEQNELRRKLREPTVDATIGLDDYTL